MLSKINNIIPFIYATKEIKFFGINLAKIYRIYVSENKSLAMSNSCDPMDYSLPSSSVHGILQARILEWVAIPFSRGSSLPRGWTWVSWIAGRFLTIWVTREVWSMLGKPQNSNKRNLKKSKYIPWSWSGGLNIFKMAVILVF